MRPTTTCLTESGGLQQGAEHGITTVEDAVRSVQAQHVGIGVKKLASEIKALFPYLDCTRKQVRAVLNNARQGGDRGPPSSHVPEDDSHLAPFVDDLFRDQGPITYEHLPGKGRRPPPLQPPPQQQQQQQNDQTTDVTGQAVPANSQTGVAGGSALGVKIHRDGVWLKGGLELISQPAAAAAEAELDDEWNHDGEKTEDNEDTQAAAALQGSRLGILLQDCDALQCVLNHVDEDDDALCAALACTTFRDLLFQRLRRRPKGQQHEGKRLVTSVAGVASSVSRLEWVRGLGAGPAPGWLRDWDWYTCRCLASVGKLEVLQWARAHGCEWNERTCEVAATRGHLEILQWARVHGCEWNREYCLQVGSQVSKWVKGPFNS
jgi:hypothetical protein